MRIDNFKSYDFLNFRLWVKDLNMFDIKNEFCAKNYPYGIGDLQTPGIEDLAQIIGWWMFHIFSYRCWFVKHTCLAFFRGSGGFRELREACRKHLHLSWYLSDTVVPSYGKHM